MAKKKHNFQHRNAPKVAAAPTTATTTAKPTATPNEWQEVRADVRKTLILGSVFIALMIGLWLLFEYSSVGPSLYNTIKL